MEALLTSRDFKAFAALVKKLRPGSKGYAAWADRPGLPKSVRAFWKAVGVPPYKSAMLPKASKAEDEAVLKQVFEGWFSDAATRDRWALEPEDEPIPWRHLPANPRVVASTDGAVLLASDIDPEPSLHVLWRHTPRTTRLRFSYFFWCMREVLVRATTTNSANYWFDRRLKSEPVLPDLKLGVSKVRDGIYSITKFKEDETDCFVYRDLNTLIDFVLSLPPKKRECVDTPHGSQILVRLSKKQELDPRLKRIDLRFTPIPLQGGTTRLVGRIEGYPVWIVRNGQVGEVAVLCDTEAQEPVKSWLKSGGARITETRVVRRLRSNYWID